MEGQEVAVGVALGIQVLKTHDEDAGVVRERNSNWDPSLAPERQVAELTLLHDEDAGVVKEEVAEGVALGIHVWLPTEAGRLEEREGLQGPQGSLALGHRHR